MTLLSVLYLLTGLFCFTLWFFYTRDKEDKEQQRTFERFIGFILYWPVYVILVVLFCIVEYFYDKSQERKE
ncbi:MAG: hypothetical protein AABY22_31275 [Nanoarchaeota archaeon]